MAQAIKPKRQNGTITVDFKDETSYFQLLDDGKAFVEFVLAFVLSLGFQLHHKLTCDGGGALTRYSHYVRVRLGGLTIWRLQCTSCKAVFTVLPHFILRYRQHASRCRSTGFDRYPRWPQPGVVRNDVSYLTDGPLPFDLRLGPTPPA